MYRSLIFLLCVAFVLTPLCLNTALAEGVETQTPLFSAHQLHESVFGTAALLEEAEQAAIPPVQPTADFPGLNSGNRMAETDYVFFGYHPYWADGEEDYYRYDLMTHMCYFRVGINTDGTIYDDIGWKTRSSFLAIKNYCQQFNITLVLCATKFSGIETFLDNSTAQTNAINNLLAEVKAKVESLLEKLREFDNLE